MTQPHAHPLARRSRRPAPGFTLVELLASIALVLLLVIGINEVFGIASRGIGAGQALSTVQRDNRTLHPVLYTDLRNAVTTDFPFFMFRSERVAAFRSATEAAGDRDYNDTLALADADDAIRSIDIDGDNAESLAEGLSRTTLTARNHRVDSLRFFARDLYRRQTGNDGVFVADMAGAEAYIVYGHLRQPQDLTGAAVAGARDPGLVHDGAVQTAADNPNNFYAQQWLLGRSALVMREPIDTSGTGGGPFVINDNATPTPNAQYYVARSSPAAPTAMSPFVTLSPTSVDGTSPAGPLVWHSRYDLMGISIRRAKDVMVAAIAARGLPQTWWDEGDLNVSFRFAGFPYPTRPHTSEGLARTAPVLLAGCSQFVVEYAGDFTTQNPITGAVSAYAPDGTTDFVPLPNGGALNPVRRRIRWYGFPRNVDPSDDNATTGPDAAPAGVRIRGATGAAAGATDMLDVVPLRDVLAASTIAEPAAFERDVAASLPVASNYAALASVAAGASYTCAWGPAGSHVNTAGLAVPDPAMPRMIRVIIGMDDQGNRLPEPQLYEYVVELQ